MAQPNAAKTPEQKLTRAERAWSLRASGKSLRGIAKELNISHVAVFNLLNEVYAKRSGELDKVVDAHKLRQLDVLDHVIEEAVEAWDESKKDAETHKVNTKELGKAFDKGTPESDGRDPEDVDGGLYIDAFGNEIEPEERARKLREAGMRDLEQSLTDEVSLTIVEKRTALETKGQTGNPAHLNNVLNALKAQRDILGLDAPKVAEITGKGGSPLLEAFSVNLVKAYGDPDPGSSE